MNKDLATLLYFMHNRRFEFVKQFDVLHNFETILFCDGIYNKSTKYKRTEPDGIEILKSYFSELLNSNLTTKQKINLLKEQVYQYLLANTEELYAKINLQLFSGSIYYLVTGVYIFETVTKTMLKNNHRKRGQKKGNFKKKYDARRFTGGNPVGVKISQHKKRKK